MPFRYLSLNLLAIMLFFSLAGCSKDDSEEPVDQSAPETIFINEINSTGDPDWLELYNYGEETVDIEGFIIFDKVESKYVLPSGHQIKSGEFLILYCDDQGAGLNLPFKLTSEGESITLQRPDGKMIDHVVFPAMQNSQTYARFPDGSTTWKMTGFATKNASNGTGPIASFTSKSHSPQLPMVGEDITFSVEVSDPSNVANVQLYHAVDNAGFTMVNMTSGDSKNYSAKVSALTSDGDLLYYFKLTDKDGSEVLLPEKGNENPYDLTITSGEVPSLVINEVMASNSGTLADPDGTDEYDDWIEIYNAGSTAVDMARFYFSDSENPFDDRIQRDAPDKTTIAPGGHLLFWADSDTEQGPNHLKFKLSVDGEVLSLYYKDGRLIDKHVFGQQSTDVSEGRSTDGAATWIKFTTPTPGSANK
ncbi:MAG: lamin tail domain-containing protein [Cyclobacteriaceae bacterium]|nr:lamin tail domain-containing protein [Cyclobacteriaceae bacterium]